MTLLRSLKRVTAPALVALATATAISAPRPALACGGFFCSQSQPIQQDAERIVFKVNDNNTISAMVNIEYSGPAHKFAWVLPVPGVPDVQVGNAGLLARVDNATAPRYIVRRNFPTDCGSGGPNGSSGAPGISGMGGSGGGSGGGGGSSVTVLKESSVGPYDYVVIKVDPTLPDLADVAMDWLKTNGYDTTTLEHRSDSQGSTLIEKCEYTAAGGEKCREKKRFDGMYRRS